MTAVTHSGATHLRKVVNTSSSLQHVRSELRKKCSKRRGESKIGVLRWRANVSTPRTHLGIVDFFRGGLSGRPSAIEIRSRQFLSPGHPTYAATNRRDSCRTGGLQGSAFAQFP